MGVVPACPGLPVIVAVKPDMPAIEVTTACASPSRSSTGPCSMCTSTNAAGSVPPPSGSR
jgi:hypothetical protein